MSNCDSTTSSTAVQGVPCRRWYSLHFSTWLLLLVGVAVCVLVIVPGDKLRPYNFLNHGWPATFLTRSPAPQTSWVLDNAEVWGLTRDIKRFRIGALALDIGVATTILASVVWAFERQRRKHRRLQFSLRALLLGVTIVAFVMGWWMWQRQADKQLRAELKAYTGYHYPMGSLVPRFPLWMRALIGDDRLIPLGFNRPPEMGTHWTREDHEHIKFLVDRFPDDISVSLNEDDDLSSDDLDRFAELTRLENLSVSKGSLDFWKRLDRFTNLRGISKFREGPEITDEGLAHLRFATRIEWLNVSDTGITDAGVEPLCAMPEMQDLFFGRSKITDAGVARLCSCLKRLRSLCLAASLITDKGLVSISELPELQDLNVFYTNVTDSGVARLKHALPNLNVTYESETNDLAKLRADIAQIRSGESNGLTARSPKISDANLGD